MDSSKDPWEDNGIIDLVFEITSSASVDKCTALECVIEGDFRVWVGKGKNYGFFSHCFYVLFFKCARA